MTLHATDKLGQGEMIFLHVDLSAIFRTEIRLPQLHHVNFHAGNATSFKPPTQELLVAK